MKSKYSTGLIITGITILSIFTYVISINLLPQKTSGKFFMKDNNCEAVIKTIQLENGQLIVETNEKTKAICVKLTKSTPEQDAMCWKNVDNKTMKISVFEGKEYYIWMKDINNFVSVPTIYNTNTKSIINS
jgi:hypothetical protein